MGPNHRCIRLRKKFLLKLSPFKWTVDAPGVICAVWHDGSAGLREESFGTSKFFFLVYDNSWASVHSGEHKPERILSRHRWVGCLSLITLPRRDLQHCFVSGSVDVCAHARAMEIQQATDSAHKKFSIWNIS